MPSLHLKMLLTTLLPIVSLLAGRSAGAAQPTHDARRENANHIFNAIHSSMRQWGSSLNHNGMSFFLATVPAGTQLYHGTTQQDMVQGMEWLAFEPEHALVFARPRGPSKGWRPGKPPGEGEDGETWEQDEEFGQGVEGDGMWEAAGDGEAPLKKPHHPHEPPKHDEPFHLPGKHHDGPFPPPPDHKGPPPPPPMHHGPPPPHPFPGHPHGPPEGDDSPPPPPPFDPHHRPSYPPPPGLPPMHPPPSGPPPHGKDPLPPPPHHRRPPPPPRRDRQQPLTRPNPLDINTAPDNRTGYLHTYIPTHPLRLLYIDGLSAGKTNNGTLDTQDLLLLNLSAPIDGGPMGGERARATGLCDLATTQWAGAIDGVLRMEGGFEIILCDFGAHLELRDVLAVETRGWGGPGGWLMGGWRYIQAVAGRYGGIGGGRVVLDYERFVSVFEYGGLDLWTNDVVSDTPHPRLVNARPEQVREMRAAVADMVVSGGGRETVPAGTNWQAVADMVVRRYSAALHNLHTDAAVRSNKEAFAASVAALLAPFVASAARNSTLEAARCVAQFVPALPPVAPSLAHSTIHTVTEEICTTLLAALDITSLSLSRSLAPTSPPPSHALDLIDTLVNYLAWTTWKECGPCADEEVCFVPIWPMGSLEEHRKPTCTTEEGVGSGYWGRFGPPGGRRPGGGPGEGPAPEDVEMVHGQARGRGHRHGSWKGHRGGKHCGRRGQGGVWGRVLHNVGRLMGWVWPRPRNEGKWRR